MTKQSFPRCRISFFNLVLALLFAAGLLIPSFTPTARSEDLFVLGGGGAGHTISGNSTYENVTVFGGGGDSGGGEAILNAGDLDVTADIKIGGGTSLGGPSGSGSLNGVSLTVGGTLDISSNDGGASLIITNTVKAPTIKLAGVARSNLAFNAGALDITSNNTDLFLGGTVVGTNSIAKGDNGVYIGAVKLGNFNFTVQPVNDNYSGVAALGILELQGNGNLIDNNNLLSVGSLTINGGTLNNANWTGIIDHAYTISDDITLGLDGATINLGTGEDKTLSRNLIGAGSLVKDGAGVLTLSGANTYTGMTSITGGTLALGVDNALASSAGLILYGGATFDQSSFSNSWNGKTFAVNSVNGSSAIYNGNLSATNATLHFISTSDMTAPLLTVNGTVDISGSSVNVGLTGNAILSKDTTITLIDSGSNTLTANNLQKESGVIKIGSTIVHDVTTHAQVDQTSNKLTATIGTGRASEESKSLSEGYLGGMGLITNGANLASNAGKAAAVKVGDDIESGFSAFTVVQGGTTRYNTGSYLDLNSVSLLAGLALGTEIGPGTLTTGAFFEYGYGTYNTYNSFDNAPSVKGDGNSNAVGGGVVLRLEFAKAGPGKIYAEGMGRIGNLSNKYNSSDLRNTAGVATSYNTSSLYYGANAGMGYIWDISKMFSLDVYAKYFWARLNSSDLTLSTGEALRFSEIDSHNLRIGGRFGYVPHRIVTVYAGAAFEQEFDGKAEATTNGFAIDAPSFAGSTGLGEFGLTITPHKDYDFTIDLGVQGFGGKRQGVSGSFQLKFAI